MKRLGNEYRTVIMASITTLVVSLSIIATACQPRSATTIEPVLSSTPDAAITDIETLVLSSMPATELIPSPTLTGGGNGSIVFSLTGHSETFGFVDNIYVARMDTLIGRSVTDFESGVAYMPVWSPDAEQIAFAYLEPTSQENNEIYVVNIDRTGLTNLTNNPASDAFPSWSPDGKHIAFVSDRDGIGSIYIMNPDGSNIVRLTNGKGAGHPAWSPDGARIAFIYDDGNTNICVMNSDGSNQIRLDDNSADDFEPAWSPDGTKIVFSSMREGNTDIFMMNADGSQITRLTDDPEDERHPSWSADGTKIIFQTGKYAGQAGHIWIMNADGSNISPLEIDFRPWPDSLIGLDWPKWSP